MDAVALALEHRVNAADAFVLSADVALVPCAELNDRLRGRLTFDDGDYTLTQLHGRARSQVIDGDTAALLRLFREPRTIVDAVVEGSRLLGKDAREWLDELLPHLDLFVHNRVLVPAGAEGGIAPRFGSGDEIAGWTVVRCVNFIEDTEIYQLRRGGELAALKIARRAGLKTLFENEADVLRHLDGSGIAPRLLEAGSHDGLPYLLLEWIDGVESSVAAAQRRHDRAALLELCAAIAEAYATLHARGVLHGDVHPRNILAGGRVTLVDFGYSRFADKEPRLTRAGVPTFYEPEALGASAPPSAAGEQFALGALLYFLIAGAHYVDFRLDREEMNRQIAHEPPLPFAKRGIPPWPDVEAILFRALEKDPARRFASVAEMAALLAAARDRAVRDAVNAPLSAEAHALLEATLRSFARGGAMFAARFPPPTSSVYVGAAGAALGILRIAEARNDAALLALAQVWHSRAVARIGDAGAFDDGDKLTVKSVGEVTPFHTESGVHAAGAIIAAARGDSRGRLSAVRAFLRASQHPCPELDLTLGRSGTLLAAALLAHDGLRAFGAETMRAIWDELDARPPIASCDNAYLGIAHGWAGYLYAALRWCAASGDAPPPRLAERLDEFAALAQPDGGRGVVWPMRVGGTKSMPGWCHGTAGELFLFTLAHRLLGDERWLRLAEQCAWHTWESPQWGGSLCCGSTGHGYALLNLYKHTGASEWLSRARQMANVAASMPPPPSRENTLWRGALGIAALVADLSSPENARMPFFE